MEVTEDPIRNIFVEQEGGKDIYDKLDPNTKTRLLDWVRGKPQNEDDTFFIKDFIAALPRPVLFHIKNLKAKLSQVNSNGGSRRRRRPSRKYKKSSKRVFRKKSRSTRRR
ncbi:MAG: hypothetical protein EBU66_12750 [Bacteroidetes bacterium]|nr:hypothetical protein [bacterium]NBP65514.1 hypothetical protein [Bacteroidota bacterium]